MVAPPENGSLLRSSTRKARTRKKTKKAKTIATFASPGYAVLRPNPRGSSGYGKDFRCANQKDSGGADYQDLMSFNGTADIPNFVPDYFGGQAWEDMEIYQKHSPMFSVIGVSTPTLIQHGEADVRVPISQGYEFYNALKAQNVPVRMIVLPRQPPGPNEPKMQIAAMQSNLDWFEKYLGGNSAQK